MPLGTAYPTQNCPVARSLEVIGERWTLLIIRDLFYGVRRFNDFRKHLSIPTAILTTRLEHLIDEGVVSRVAGRAGAARDEYELTSKGETLWPVVWSLVSWGNENYVAPEYRRVATHERCGTVLSKTGACDQCGVMPGAHDVVLQERKVEAGTDPVSIALKRPHRLLEPLAT